MTAWSIAPWLIALFAAGGLGAFGRFSDRRRRRADDVESEQETAPVEYTADQTVNPDDYY